MAVSTFPIILKIFAKKVIELDPQIGYVPNLQVNVEMISHDVSLSVQICQIARSHVSLTSFP